MIGTSTVQLTDMEYSVPIEMQLRLKLKNSWVRGCVVVGNNGRSSQVADGAREASSEEGELAAFKNLKIPWTRGKINRQPSDHPH